MFQDYEDECEDAFFDGILGFFFILFLFFIAGLFIWIIS